MPLSLRWKFYNKGDINPNAIVVYMEPFSKGISRGTLFTCLGTILSEATHSGTISSTAAFSGATFFYTRFTVQMRAGARSTLLLVNKAS